MPSDTTSYIVMYRVCFCLFHFLWTNCSAAMKYNWCSKGFIKSFKRNEISLNVLIICPLQILSTVYWPWQYICVRVCVWIARQIVPRSVNGWKWVTIFSHICKQVYNLKAAYCKMQIKQLVYWEHHIGMEQLLAKWLPYAISNIGGKKEGEKHKNVCVCWRPN